MKNLYKLLIGVLALSTVTSCDDYLEWIITIFFRRISCLKRRRMSFPD